MFEEVSVILRTLLLNNRRGVRLTRSCERKKKGFGEFKILRLETNTIP